MRANLEEQMRVKEVRIAADRQRDLALIEQVRREEDEMNQEDALEAARKNVQKRLYAQQVVREKAMREQAARDADNRRRAQVKEDEERDGMRKDLLERRAARALRQQLEREGFTEAEIRGIGLGPDGEGIPASSVAGTRRGKKVVPTRGIDGVE